MESKQLNNMISQLVDWYAHYEDGLLQLNIFNIPESDLNNLSALMISQDDDLAAEACGPDNPEWEKSMHPALIRTMQSQKNGYTMEDFHDVWTAGVRNYLMPRITRLIEERLESLNEHSGCHVSLVWDRGSEKVIEIRPHG